MADTDTTATGASPDGKVDATATATAGPDRGDLAGLEAGLDALDAVTEQGPSLPVRIRRAVVPPIVAAAVLIAVWQGVYAAHLKPEWVLPSPLQVWDSLVKYWQNGTIPAAVQNSLHRGGLGFLMSLAVGTPLGILVARFRVVRTAIGPTLSGLQTLPSVAWVIPAILWFGLTNKAVYAVVLLGAVPSIANGLVAGIDQIPPLYQRVGRVLGARGLDSVRYVLLPAALPGYLAGLKQGWAFSWRSLMAAELITISSSIPAGLGQFLNQGRELDGIRVSLAAIIVILLVGIGVDLLLFAPIERRVLRARGLTGIAR